jgi:hypothetical protein
MIIIGFGRVLSVAERVEESVSKRCVLGGSLFKHDDGEEGREERVYTDVDAYAGACSRAT